MNRYKQSGMGIQMILGIIAAAALTAIAYPKYMSYTEKAKFAEIVRALAPIKKSIEICPRTLGVSSRRFGSRCSEENRDNPMGSTEVYESVETVAELQSIKDVFASGEDNIVTVGIETSRIFNDKETFTYYLNATMSKRGNINWEIDEDKSNCDDFEYC